MDLTPQYEACEGHPRLSYVSMFARILCATCTTPGRAEIDGGEMTGYMHAAV